MKKSNSNKKLAADECYSYKDFDFCEDCFDKGTEEVEELIGKAQENIEARHLVDMPDPVLHKELYDLYQKRYGAAIEIQGKESIYEKQLIQRKLNPNDMADWVNLRNDSFSYLTDLAPDNKLNINSKSFFILNTNGVVSGRTHFVYNFSKNQLIETNKKMISFFNEELNKFQNSNDKNVEKFVDKDEKFIKWDDKLFRKISII